MHLGLFFKEIQEYQVQDPILPVASAVPQNSDGGWGGGQKMFSDWAG